MYFLLKLIVIHTLCIILATIKKSEGLPVNDNDTKAKPKKKKKKNPNPLSCKKKKKKPSSAGESSKKTNSNSTIQDKTIEKKKRTRIKLPSHVKEMLLQKPPQIS